IDVAVKEISIDSSANEIGKCDFLMMGGGEDRKQEIAAKDIKAHKKESLREAIEKEIPALFICGAYQFLGQYYQLATGEKIPCLGILDLHTDNPGVGKPRCIGNIVVRAQGSRLKAQSCFLVGFENHGGRTYLGKTMEPLGRVAVGYGNNGADKTEGCVYKNTIGTYLHGPVLPKNPHFADYLIRLALFKKYGEPIELEKLDDTLEWQAHEFMLRKLGVI
ncbi:MAG: hypothetical protein Q8N98_01680, partial [bacterium]|nr:hypothetical protein [bacterium]